MKLNIATGAHRDALKWKNTETTWQELRGKLRVPVVTKYTFAEYSAMSKQDRDKVKDKGGYVGGYLQGGRRSKTSIKTRQLITLDIDFGTPFFWEDFTMQFDCEAVLHGTHSHTNESPRYRLIMPLDRPVSPDEYEAIARRIAGDLGITLFDNSTFQPSRLMYWPAIASDVTYYYEEQEGAFLCADSILARYPDWRDVTLWPANVSLDKKLRSDVGKQKDPREKKGVIGAFCRAFTISEAIATFIPDVYVPADNGRYTYTGGTSSAGLVVYDDVFAYSHHSTDPASEQLCNAYDLVRLHMFKIEGEDEKRSNFAMMEFVLGLDSIKEQIVREGLDNADSDFANLDEDTCDSYVPKTLSWTNKLELAKGGGFAASSYNIRIIFDNDPNLKGLFAFNQFDYRRYITRSAPWRLSDEASKLKEVDLAGVRSYFDTTYGISSGQKITDELELAFNRNAFHPVRDYLNSLTWDGEPRIDTLLHRCFGTEDTLYTREAIRKTLVGAVARVFVPGIKFDLILTLSGAQGIGKSRFFDKLGREWFSDTLTTVSGRESFEQLQGAWIIEMAELSALKKAEIETAKHFTTKRRDHFRPAYGHVVETYERQCVFVATTNVDDFLKDPTGNRRFMPVSVRRDRATLDIFSEEFDGMIDQIWAEAVHLFKSGEPLFLSTIAEEIAEGQRDAHVETDERKGVIENYLNQLLPARWEEMSLSERREWLRDDQELRDAAQHPREFVCVAEIWCECLGKSRDDMSRYNTRDLNDVIKMMRGWELVGTRVFKHYGKQRAYRRKEEGDDLQ